MTKWLSCPNFSHKFLILVQNEIYCQVSNTSAEWLFVLIVNCECLFVEISNNSVHKMYVGASFQLVIL